MLVYIAGPYSGNTYMDIDRNITAAEEAAIRLADAGIGFVCPHLNSAHFEVKSAAPAEFWYLMDMRLLRACDCVYMLPYWQESRGAVEEERIATALGMEVYYDLDWLIEKEGKGGTPRVRASANDDTLPPVGHRAEGDAAGRPAQRGGRFQAKTTEGACEDGTRPRVLLSRDGGLY